MKNQPNHKSLRNLLLLALLTISTSQHHSSSLRQRRKLTLTSKAARLQLLYSQTFWHRELNAASRYVERRRLQGNSNRDLSSSGECLSPLQRWFVSNINSIDPATWSSVQEYNITTLAYLYKHYVEREDGTEEYFGAYGERTNEMKGNHAGLTIFWSASSRSASAEMESASTSSAAVAQHHYLTTQSSIILLGMHGADLSNINKLIPTLQQIYSLDASNARTLATTIQEIVTQLPGGFTSPLLTSNAIATQSSDSDGSFRERDSIIVGDGVFTFLEWLDLSYDGPDYIHSHEYAHHLQYDMGEESLGGAGVGDDGSPSGAAERTQRLELMADVFGAYYLGHRDGGKMDSERLYEVHRAAFSLGDCESEHGTHHGTPRQRECASNYGANLALASYVDGGYKLSPSELRRMFNEKYQGILALDEDECKPVVDQSTLDKTIYGEDFERSEVPFYGDDGESVSVEDAAPSYLEPVVSWFDPKPKDYMGSSGSISEEAESNLQQDVGTLKNDPTEYGSYEAYEAQASAQDNGWGETFASASTDEDPLDQPPATLPNGDEERDPDADGGWFEQTKWFVKETLGISVGFDLAAPRMGVSILTSLVVWMLL
jgi:hypothetical protein